MAKKNKTVHYFFYKMKNSSYRYNLGNSSLYMSSNYHN